MANHPNHPSHSGFSPWADDDAEEDPDSAPDLELGQAEVLEAQQLQALGGPIDPEGEYEDPLVLMDRPSDSIPVDAETGEPLADIPPPPPKPDPKMPRRKPPVFEVQPDGALWQYLDDGTVIQVKRKYKAQVRILEPATRARFIKALEMFGTWQKAADAVMCSSNNARFYSRTVPAFGAECEAARARYAANIQAEAWRRAMKGVKKPVMGGQFKDQVVAWETVYSDRLLETLLKGTNKEMSERNLNVHHDGRVEHAHAHVILDPQKIRAMPKEKRDMLRALLEELKPDAMSTAQKLAAEPNAGIMRKREITEGNTNLVAAKKKADAKFENKRRDLKAKMKAAEEAVMEAEENKDRSK